ncbi:MAG: tetratricopeptide repeat protein [Verrucomicrobia bacterium]|nr:tetratricopeptide repeat protein [Verrucomicrobiota bacterium]
MTLRSTFTPCFMLVVLTLGLLRGSAAGEVDALRKMAAEKRQAIIRFQFQDKDKQGGIDGPYGFFVSGDGTALCDLTAFAEKQKPTAIETFNGRKLAFPVILGIFPDSLIALVKFKYQPKVWIDVARTVPAMGTKVAVLDYGSDVPAAIGPLLSRESLVTSEYRQNRFCTYLSIGSAIRLRGTSTSGAAGGVPVIDGAGAAVGLFVGATHSDRQVIPICLPLDELPPWIEKTLKAGTTLPFPLPDAAVPFDPVGSNPEYVDMADAFYRNDLLAARRHLKNLKAAHPQSSCLRNMEFEMAGRTGETDRLLDLAAALKPAPGAPQAECFDYYCKLGLARCMTGDVDGAFAAAEEVIRISPENCSAGRELLGMLFATKGRNEEAAKWFLAASAISPEKIPILQRLEKILGNLKKWEEQEKVTNQIFRLEQLYSR